MLTLLISVRLLGDGFIYLDKWTENKSAIQYNIGGNIGNNFGQKYQVKFRWCKQGFTV